MDSHRTTTHPTQVTLPGQTHTADGPHDQTGMYVMHHAFRRDLEAFVSAIRATPVREAAVWTALEHRWDRFAEILHHHHEVEDTAVWPVLVAHAEASGAAEDLATLEAMEAEHAVVDPALEACRVGFTEMRQHPCADHRNALDVRVTAFREALLDHMRHEECEALPLLQRTMTPQEFETAEKHSRRSYPARLIPFLVAWALLGLPDEGRRRILETAGPAYRLVDLLTRRRFARREQSAFRYA